MARHQIIDRGTGQKLNVIEWDGKAPLGLPSEQIVQPDDGAPIWAPPPELTGAALLDVLTDAEAGASGVRPRDLLRIAARANDVIPVTNAKLTRILAKNPGLTYEALIARLPGTA